jgi:hypothetical protein
MMGSQAVVTSSIAEIHQTGSSCGEHRHIGPTKVNFRPLIVEKYIHLPRMLSWSPRRGQFAVFQVLFPLKIGWGNKTGPAAGSVPGSCI